MKNRRGFALLACAVALSAVGPALVAQTGASASVFDQESLQRAVRVREVFEEIEADHRAGRTTAKQHLILEPDLNAFLAHEILVQRPPAVERVSVSLRPDNRFVTRIRVDLDDVSVGDSSIGSLFKALMSGSQDLEVEGRLQTANGSGTYEIEGASLNGIPIPATLVNAILRSVGARLDPPFDPTAPFQLDHGIQSVRIESGRAVIETGKR